MQTVLLCLHTYRSVVYRTHTRYSDHVTLFAIGSNTFKYFLAATQRSGFCAFRTTLPCIRGMSARKIVFDASSELGSFGISHNPPTRTGILRSTSPRPPRTMIASPFRGAAYSLRCSYAFRVALCLRSSLSSPSDRSSTLSCGHADAMTWHPP